MSLYTVKVAVKYEQTIALDATDKEDAVLRALDDAAEIPEGAAMFEGCPYVVEVREANNARVDLLNAAGIQ